MAVDTIFFGDADGGGAYIIEGEVATIGIAEHGFFSAGNGSSTIQPPHKHVAVRDIDLKGKLIAAHCLGADLAALDAAFVARLYLKNAIGQG